MEFSSYWSVLPGSNLQQIFRGCEISDVQNCLFVCKHWNYEADFYLQRRVRFVVDKVHNVEDVQGSRRRFQEVVLVANATERHVTVLEALKKRTFKTSKIIAAYVPYEDYATLSKIMELLGNGLKTLHLKNYVIHPCYFYSEFRHVLSVENLIITNIDYALNNISLKFSNLKMLSLLTTEGRGFFNQTPHSVLKDFLISNPSLKTLKLDKYLIEEETLLPVILSCETGRNLTELEIGILQNYQDYEDIGNNMVRLENLQIGPIIVQPQHVEKILQLPNLKRISMVYGFRGAAFYKQLFSGTQQNYKITTLVLDDLFMENESGLIACINCFPNMRSFRTCSVYWAIHSFNIIHEMATKWGQLETLYLKFIRLSLPPDNQDTYEKNPINLQKLTHLELGGIDLHAIEILIYIKAVNLKFLGLHIHTPDLDNLKTSLSILNINCPNVERLELTGINPEVDLIIFITTFFQKVKTLYFGYHLSMNHVMSENDVIEFLKYFKSGFPGKPILHIHAGLINLPIEKLQVIVHEISTDGRVEFKNGYLKRIFLNGKEVFIL